MEKIELFCDVCEKPLIKNNSGPYVDLLSEAFGIQNHEVYTTLKRDTKSIFPHLCKHCAGKLDYMFEKLDEQEQKYVNLIKKRHEINELRKKQLNTKG